MEIYKSKWMVLGALGFMNNADLKKKSKYIVLDLYICIYMEIYKWKWMELGALECMNNIWKKN